MKTIYAISLSLTLLIAGCGQGVKNAGNEADPLAPVMMAETSGCLEGPAQQFGRYLGDWNMTSQSLSREDGVTWTDGGNARWNFTCVGPNLVFQVGVIVVYSGIRNGHDDFL